MRIYDPRVGRFLSVDPITGKYPELTPYQFASNTPIQAIDLDGEEAGFVINWIADKAKAAGQPRLSGFIRSFGGTDPYYNATQLGKKVFHGDFKGAAVQVFGYMPTGMVYNLGKTIYNAATGDKEAQGNLIGVASQIAIVHATTGASAAASADVTNTSAATAMGDAKAPEPSAAFSLAPTYTGVDLMGGSESRYPGMINYDMNAKSGITDVVENFGEHFGKGTVDEIVVDNPQTNFIEQVTDQLKSGGTITVRGGMSNKYFKGVFNGTAKGLENYEVESRTENVNNPGFKHTDAKTPVGGQVNEIVLKKKGTQ